MVSKQFDLLLVDPMLPVRAVAWCALVQVCSGEVGCGQLATLPVTLLYSC